MTWVRILSESEFFLLTFLQSASEKKLISFQIHIEKSRRKISFRFDDKMFLTVLLYALKKKYLKDNEKNITEANIDSVLVMDICPLT